MAGSGSTEHEAVVPTNADLSNAIVGLGNKADDTYSTDAQVTSAVSAEATARNTAIAASVAALKTYAVAGADNSSTHDYTATGVKTTSTVFGALAFKDQATVVAAVAGTITPGADKITVASGADLSSGFTLVFLVVK